MTTVAPEAADIVGELKANKLFVEHQLKTLLERRMESAERWAIEEEEYRMRIDAYDKAIAKLEAS